MSTPSAVRATGRPRSLLRGDDVIQLAGRGASVDHLTAAANTAALIETVASRPGARILNSADPDTPTAEQIVRAIGARLEWTGHLELLNETSDTEQGRHPWQSAYPIRLDTSASLQLGYAPAGNSNTLLNEEIDWVATQMANAR